MTKNARLFAVKEIIGSKSIGNQDELRLELKKAWVCGNAGNTVA